MWMKVALMLGYRSVAEAQANLPEREFMEWVAYDRVRPLERQDWRIASVVHAVVKAFGGKGVRNLKLHDFVLDFNKPPKEPQTAESIMQKMSGWIKGMTKRGRVKQGGDD